MIALQAAGQAGVCVGDLLQRVNDVDTLTKEDFMTAVKDACVGEMLGMTVARASEGTSFDSFSV